VQFLLSTFGVHNPEIGGALPDHAGFPVSSEHGPELDLDYTSLLLADHYVMDEDAYWDVIGGRRPFLKPMAATLKFLKAEGILTTVKMRETARQYSAEVRRRTNLLVEDPTDWLPAARAQWQAVGRYMREFHARHAPQSDRLLNTSHFGVYNYLRSRDGIVAESELDRLTRLLNTRRRILRSQDADDLRGVIRCLVGEVMMNEAIRTKLDMPLLDWDDARPFYDRLHLTTWDEADEVAKACEATKRLLDFTIPDLRPRNVEEVVRFIRDEKAVQSLRNEMLSAVRSGEQIDAKWFAEYVNEAVRRDLTVKGRVKKLRWVGAGVSTLLPGGPILQEAALSFGQEAVEGVLTDNLEEMGVSRHRWYYALQANAMGREPEGSRRPWYKRWLRAG
jgi:hypothetical protein